MARQAGQFDPLAQVVEWLDACRSGRLDDVLSHFDETATLECDCDCEGKQVHCGNAELKQYWRRRFAMGEPTRFRLEAIWPRNEGVTLHYIDQSSRTVRMVFRFNDAGKFVHVSCGPM